MDDNKQKSVWNDVQKQAKTTLDMWKKRNSQLTSSSLSTLTDKQVDKDTFLNEELPKKLCEILDYWHTNHSLDKTQKDTFQECSEYLLEVSKNNSELIQWFNQQGKLIDLVKQCCDDIASHGYYLDIKGTEDPNIGSFDRLIQAFTNSNYDQLLDVISRCIFNRLYNETLYNIGKTNASTLSLTQQFLLVTCPDYILTCDQNKSQLRKFLEYMLPHYAELFTHFLPNIEKWTDTVVLCLLYPIRAILSDSNSLPLEEKRLIQEALITILVKQPLSNSNYKEEHITLVYATLNVLLEIVRSEHKLLGEMKKETADNSKLLEILKQLSTDKQNEKVQLHALELLSFLVPEKEFLKTNDSAKVTELFAKNFNEALEDNKDRTVDDLMQGLKGLVQSEEIKQQFVEQNVLPSIMQYTKETSDDPAPLEAAYALAFNSDARKAFKEDQEFVDHVEKMKQSDNKDVTKAAHGIMWKLEDEEKFKKEADEKKSNEQSTKETKESTDDKETKESTDDKEKPEQYDMMISYCWAQKELCHKLNDRLEKDGYTVWLDRDEMRGSIVECMAEAIEHSKCVLICMSSDYKSSTNCQAEAEYAFNRKSKMIPLMVEKDYKPDGWLGFMAGSKLYVDFADKEDEEFDAAYELLIAELKRQEADENAENEEAKLATDSSEAEPTPEKAEPPPIQTRQYLSVGPVTTWTDVHVNEFITDNELDLLLPICKSMDGPLLHEFHQACQATPSAMFTVTNKSLEGSPIPLDVFFKFILKLKQFIPPLKRPSVIFFRYDFVYAPLTTSTQPVNASKV
ncbi:unnamed protein product [Adineta steineri]|uniref:TIR domain-containing protein n=3 Tax=Adineta steineri TaxID=433720 RepID=A0A819PRT9_9BILA|nr:unnamed protein product [Adineta steineri]